MRLRHHFNTGTEKVVRGDLSTDGNGVVQFTPPKLREWWEAMIVDSWPEHPGEYLHIDAGEEWLRGLLWMSDMGRFSSGRTWLTVVEEERAHRPSRAATRSSRGSSRARCSSSRT